MVASIQRARLIRIVPRSVFLIVPGMTEIQGTEFQAESVAIVGV